MAQRPTNIGFGSISQYKFPITAIASILHRVSGVIIFLLIPFLLWAFYLSLKSPVSYAHLQVCFSSSCSRFFAWVFLSALVYHLIAGIKHLLMDIGYFEELCCGKIASIAVMALSAIAIVSLGVWLW
jgi:succinate dehydrogenase / fumarate reductase cytochrome b subunit